MTAQFWLGLATIPALAAIGYVVVILWSYLRQTWRSWKPSFVRRKDRRARYAASLAVARRVWVLTTPGGHVLAWKSTVPSHDDSACQAWAHVRDALAEAEQDSLVMREERTTRDVDRRQDQQLDERNETERRP